MRRHTSHMDLPTPKVNEKQDVVRYQPAQGPDLGGEEIRRHEDVHMHADELFPRGGRLALWRRWDAVAFEDVAHRLRTDRQAQVGQGADDAVIAPGAILLGYTHDQGLPLWVNHGATRSLTLGGAVTLLGHELTVPAKNGLGLDDRRHFLQSLLAQLLANLGEDFALAIAESYAPFDLVT